MRASSSKLEIDIILDKNEVINLKDRPLDGFLKFYEDDGDIRQIPFRLQYISLDIEQIAIVQNPSNVYFGSCRDFKIIIYDCFYQDLMEKGSCGDRFYNSGKVIIKVR